MRKNFRKCTGILDDAFSNLKLGTVVAVPTFETLGSSWG